MTDEAVEIVMKRFEALHEITEGHSVDYSSDHYAVVAIREVTIVRL